MVVQTALVFWHAPAIPISQIPVFPPNPRLVKLSIAAIEPIDDVVGQTVRKSGGNGSGACFLPHFGQSPPNPSKRQARPSLPHFLQFLAVVLVSVLVWTVIPSNFRRREEADGKSGLPQNH